MALLLRICPGSITTVIPLQGHSTLRGRLLALSPQRPIMKALQVQQSLKSPFPILSSQPIYRTTYTHSMNMRVVGEPEVPSLPQSITGPAAELPHASPEPGLIPSYMPMMPSHESIAFAERRTLDTELPFSPHRQWQPVQDPRWPDSMSRVEDPWLSAHGTICHTAEAAQAAYSWPSSATPVAIPLPQDLAAQTTAASSAASLQSVGGPATFAAAQYAAAPVYDIPPPRRRGPRRRAPSAPHHSLPAAPGPSMRRDLVPLAPSPAAYSAHALGASSLPERAPPHAPSHTPRSSQPSTQVAPASAADLPAPPPQQTAQETAAAPAHNAAAGPSTSVAHAAEPEAAGRTLPAARFLDVGYCAYLKALCERVPCELNTDVCGLDGCTDVVPQAAIGSHVRDNHPHFTVRGSKHMCPRDHGGRRRGSTGIRGENFIRHLRDEWGTAARCILCKDGGVWLVRPEAAYIERHLKTCRAFPHKGRHALFPAAETDEERVARLVKTRRQLQNGKRRRAAAALEGADADADAAEHQEEHVDGGSEERDKNEDDDSVDSPRRKRQRHSRE
ncbi:hypothetical protein PHLGIDRAFT_118867 [Phlebiopsis gigantea 11061_1 CR5-6]|uniref:Uncharacterized protein n=1 Tax=Phlebiopsis gigantea (strain 11061_1 CR5-6) TaxID=745531 RepID=A0A0C3RXG6_PHLG1|nr:hypothetical protein PHLGIDRAFT_118867 [Phlebiopsis gigantea 11061_1 CR5-6]